MLTGFYQGKNTSEILNCACFENKRPHEAVWGHPFYPIPLETLAWRALN